MLRPSRAFLEYFYLLKEGINNLIMHLLDSDRLLSCLEIKGLSGSNHNCIFPTKWCATKLLYSLFSWDNPKPVTMAQLGLIPYGQMTACSTLLLVVLNSESVIM